MTTRADVERLRRANDAVVTMARRDLAAFWATLSSRTPEVVRDELLEFVPILVREYGEVAATAASEWYEDVRSASSVRGRFRAQPGGLASEGQVTGSVRYAAGSLFTDVPENALATIDGAVQRYVSYASRDTVRRNVHRDPAKPRFARVPSGAKTCAWCEMLASRGFVYRSKELAGDLGRGVGDEFHDDCNCQVVVEFDRHSHHIAGYDPDAMYERYLAAVDEAGGPGATDDEVAVQMRRLFPGRYTDGVHEGAA